MSGGFWKPLTCAHSPVQLQAVGVPGPPSPLSLPALHLPWMLLATVPPADLVLACPTPPLPPTPGGALPPPRAPKPEWTCRAELLGVQPQARLGPGWDARTPHRGLLAEV